MAFILVPTAAGFGNVPIVNHPPIRALCSTWNNSAAKAANINPLIFV